MLNGLSFPSKLSDLVLTSNKIAEQLINICSTSMLKQHNSIEVNLVKRLWLPSHGCELSLCSFTDPTQWGAFGIIFDAK